MASRRGPLACARSHIKFSDCAVAVCASGSHKIFIVPAGTTGPWDWAGTGLGLPPFRLVTVQPFKLVMVGRSFGAAGFWVLHVKLSSGAAGFP